MILPFEHYLKNGKVEKQQPDSNRAISLLEKAKKRLKYLKEINDDAADLVFEDVYEAMREASQSLMAREGYKPLSHEVIVAYLRDKEKVSEQIVHQLDSYRKLRNKSVYEAQKISITTVKEALKFAKELVAMSKLKNENKK